MSQRLATLGLGKKLSTEQMLKSESLSYGEEGRSSRHRIVEYESRLIEADISSIDSIV